MRARMFIAASPLAGKANFPFLPTAPPKEQGRCQRGKQRTDEDILLKNQRICALGWRTGRGRGAKSGRGGRKSSGSHSRAYGDFPFYRRVWYSPPQKIE